MKTILSILSLLFFAAALIPLVQARRLITGWKDHLDKPVGDEDAAFIEKRMTRFGTLASVAVSLGLLAIIWDVIILILT